MTLINNNFNFKLESYSLYLSNVHDVALLLGFINKFCTRMYVYVDRKNNIFFMI